MFAIKSITKSGTIWFHICRVQRAKTALKAHCTVQRGQKVYYHNAQRDFFVVNMSFVTELSSHKYRTLKSFIFYTQYFSLGLCSAIKGPALLDFQIATNSTMAEVTYILPAEAVGFIIGSLISAAIVGWCDCQIMIIMGGGLFGLLSIYIPYNDTCLKLCLDFLLAGLFSGFIHTGGNTWLQQIWGKAAPSFMQALHFFFGLGALFGPLLVEPFLLPLTPSEKFSNHTGNYSAPLAYSQSDVKLYWPYAVGGGVNVLTTVLFAIAYIFKQKDSPHPSMKWADNGSCKAFKEPSACVQFLITASACLFTFLNFSMELGSGYLLMTYAVKSELKLDKSTGSLMTSAFWAAFTFFRCSTVFYIDAVGCQNLIIFDLLLISVANIIMLCFSQTHVWALWVGVIIMGSGLSPTFAAMFGFLGDVIQVSSRMTSMIMVSVGCGNFVLPHIIGKYVDRYPQVFLFSNGISCVGCVALFALMVFIKHRLKK